jgi:hypothetical protein
MWGDPLPLQEGGGRPSKGCPEAGGPCLLLVLPPTTSSCDVFLLHLPSRLPRVRSVPMKPMQSFNYLPARFLFVRLLPHLTARCTSIVNKGWVRLGMLHLSGQRTIEVRWYATCKYISTIISKVR